MSILYLTSAVAGQSLSIASATTSSISYGTASTTPLTINSQAGIQFCNNSGVQLGSICNISSGGVLNCSGLSISGPLTCLSLIIPNNGTITCLGSLTCNSTLNMNSNAITSCGGLTISSGGLSISSGGLSCPTGTINMNGNAITSCGRIACSNIGSSTGFISSATTGQWYQLFVHRGSGPAIFSVIVPGNYYWYGYVTGLTNAVGNFVTALSSFNVNVLIDTNTSAISIVQNTGTARNMYWTIQYLASTDYTGGGNF